MSKEKHIFEQAFEALPKRIINSLLKSDYDSLEELHDLSDKELIKISGITKNSLSDVRALLAANGFVKEDVFEKVDAVALARTAVPVAGEQVTEGDGTKSPRVSGQVVMKINLYDPGFRRVNTGQKLSVVIGDVIWGNKNKEWDLPKKKVEELIAKGDAA